MQIVNLTALEAATAGFTHKLSLTYTDVIALTSGVAFSVYPGFNGALTFPAGCYLEGAAAYVKTAFTGGAGTLVLTSVTDGTNTILTGNMDLTVAANVVAFNLTKPVGYAAAATISATITAGTSMLNWTAGELDIYLNFSDLNELSL